MLHKTAKRPQDTKKELYDRDLRHQIMKIYLNTENKNEKKWPKVKSWEHVFKYIFFVNFKNQLNENIKK